MVVTISPSLSLYRMVVLPAASRPTISIRISFLANSRLNNLVKDSPIFNDSESTNHHTRAPVHSIQISTATNQIQTKITKITTYTTCKMNGNYTVLNPWPTGKKLRSDREIDKWKKTRWRFKSCDLTTQDADQARTQPDRKSKLRHEKSWN